MWIITEVKTSMIYPFSGTSPWTKPCEVYTSGDWHSAILIKRFFRGGEVWNGSLVYLDDVIYFSLLLVASCVRAVCSGIPGQNLLKQRGFPLEFSSAKLDIRAHKNTLPNSNHYK